MEIRRVHRTTISDQICEQMKQMILDAQTGKKKGKQKPKRVPAADFVQRYQICMCEPS